MFKRFTKKLEQNASECEDHYPVLYLFSDRVEDGRLVFDYLIRHGASPTTNALKIMALEGLPVDG